MIAAELAARLVVLPPGPRPSPVQAASLVLRNELVARDHLRLVLHSPQVARAVQPGQFVMLTIPPRVGYHALPRPMAVHLVDGETFHVIYRVKGQGTADLARVLPGESIDVIGPLGRPFAPPAGTRHAVLLARGIGVCSLTLLVPQLCATGAHVTAVISARDPGVLVGQTDLEQLDASEVLTVFDSDNSSDVDTVAAALQARGPADYLAVCGSQRLTRLTARLAREWDACAQVSVEAHMACGMGYCHGCASAPQTHASESPLVCVDGPVFGLDCGGQP